MYKQHRSIHQVHCYHVEHLYGPKTFGVGMYVCKPNTAELLTRLQQGEVLEKL